MPGLGVKKTSGAIVLAIVLAGSAPAMSDDRVEHYEGKTAESLEEAVGHFSEYNAKLSEALQKDELTGEDLETIHELTYTLENALAIIREDLAELADTLEAVHLASETHDPEDTKKHGAAYLEAARTVIP